MPMSAERYSVRVTKDDLIFSCGHFITYNVTECERLHGHNYHVAVSVDGPLDANYYVFDFIALKNRTKAIVDELDHHMLLATRNPLIRVAEVGPGVRVTFGAKEWLFPREDCVLLPIENTTAEQLAAWMARRLLAELKQLGYTPDRLAVEVEENIGQSATYEWRLK